MKVMLISLIILLIPSIALAETTFTHENKEGYGYAFDDDPLNAGGFGANDLTIKVRKRAARTTLIRPRTSFIYEMIKSVEDL